MKERMTYAARPPVGGKRHEEALGGLVRAAGDGLMAAMEVARCLGIPAETVLRWADLGLLEAVCSHGTPGFRREEVLRFLPPRIGVGGRDDDLGIGEGPPGEARG